MCDAMIPLSDQFGLQSAALLHRMLAAYGLVRLGNEVQNGDEQGVCLAGRLLKPSRRSFGPGLKATAMLDAQVDSSESP